MNEKLLRVLGWGWLALVMVLLIVSAFMIADNHPMGITLYWTGKLALVLPALTIAAGTLILEIAKRIEKGLIERDKRRFLEEMTGGPAIKRESNGEQNIVESA
jgi:hypothetical protein